MGMAHGVAPLAASGLSPAGVRGEYRLDLRKQRACFS